MVPALETARIGRARAAAVGLAEAPAEQADEDAEDGRQGRQQRQADHQVRPLPVEPAAAQRIEPVQPGAEPVPGALPAAGVAYHLAGLRGQVEQPALLVRGLHPP